MEQAWLDQLWLLSLKLNWNSWIPSPCQWVQSQIHCQPVFCWEVFRGLAAWLLQDQARSVGQRDSRSYVWKVFVEPAVHYMSILLKRASKEESLSGLTLLAPNPYGQWSVTREPWTVTRQPLERVESSQRSARMWSVHYTMGGPFCLLLGSISCSCPHFFFLSFFTFCQFFLF